MKNVVQILLLVGVLLFSITEVFAQTKKRKVEIWDEVTIIGTREREASLPGSGARVNVNDIRNQSYDDVNEILRKVPGVYLREEDGNGLFPNISLRGVDPGRSHKVTMMEDGILTAPAPYSAPSAYYSPTAGRMSGIEVLKGSSQVKYGPHTTGGAINYLSTPIPKEKNGYSKSLFGSDNEVRNHTYYGDTIDTRVGRVGFLLEHYYRENDGFKSIDSTPGFTASDNTGFIKTEPMIKFSWEPQSDTSRYQRVEAKYGYSDIKADETYLGLAESDFDNSPYRRYAGTRFDNIDTEQNRSYLRYLTEVTPEVEVALTGYYNSFQRNWHKLHSIGGGTESNLSEALAAESLSYQILKGQAAGTLNVRNNNRSYEQWGYQGSASTSFDLAGTVHELEIGVGYHTDYVRRKQNTESFTQDATGAIVASTISAPGTAGNRRQDSEAVTSYIRDRIAWGPWTFTPGFRYEYIDYEFIDFSTSGDPDTITNAADNKLTATAGGLGVTYKFSDELSAFGGAHQGFSVPGPRDNAKSGLKEETSVTGELGLRYQENGPLSSELTYFYTDFDDLLVKDNIGGAGTGETENVGDIVSQGVEFKAQYDVGVALEKDFKHPYYFTLTYTKAELDGDSNSTDAESIFSGGKDGNDVPYIPDLQLAFGSGLEIGAWGIFWDATFVGETFATASNNESQTRPDGTPDARFGKTDSFLVLDISAHYKVTEDLKAILNLQNITDEDYIVSRHPHGPRPGRPFTVLGGLELTF